MAANVGRADEVADGKIVGFDVEGVRIAVANAGGSLHAFADRCPHMGCSLSASGSLAGTTLACECHGSEFDVTSGAVLQGPARNPLAMRTVRIEGDDLLIEG